MNHFYINDIKSRKVVLKIVMYNTKPLHNNILSTNVDIFHRSRVMFH